MTVKAALDRVLSVVFHLDQESYAIPATDVIKVVETERVSRLPRLPLAIRGITQHRGRVITVIDLGVLLFARPLPVLAPGRRQSVVLIDRGHRNAGIAVDGIEEITPVKMSGSRPGVVDALRVVQHRGRAVNGILTDVLVNAIVALGGGGIDEQS